MEGARRLSCKLRIKSREWLGPGRECGSGDPKVGMACFANKRGTGRGASCAKASHVRVPLIHRHRGMSRAETEKLLGSPTRFLVE